MNFPLKINGILFDFDIIYYFCGIIRVKNHRFYAVTIHC